MQKFCRLLAPVGPINALEPLDLGRIKIQLFEKLENQKLCLEVKNKVLKSRKNFTDINSFSASADFLLVGIRFQLRYVIIYLLYDHQKLKPTSVHEIHLQYR